MRRRGSAIPRKSVGRHHRRGPAGRRADQLRRLRRRRAGVRIRPGPRGGDAAHQCGSGVRVVRGADAGYGRAPVRRCGDRFVPCRDTLSTSQFRSLWGQQGGFVALRARAPLRDGQSRRFGDRAVPGPDRHGVRCQLRPGKDDVRDAGFRQGHPADCVAAAFAALQRGRREAIPNAVVRVAATAARRTPAVVASRVLPAFFRV